MKKNRGKFSQIFRKRIKIIIYFYKVISTRVVRRKIDQKDKMRKLFVKIYHFCVES